MLDENWPLDRPLAATITGEDGTFSVTVTWIQELYLEEYPDLFVEFSTNNGYFYTRSTTPSLFGYTWRTGTEADYSGFDHDIGTWIPADDAAALSVHTDLARDWRWYQENLGVDVPATTFGIWPDTSGSVSFYVPFLREVHIAPVTQWNEGTHAHEYGHGFMDWQGIWDGFDYCNGVCDDSPDDCGHCGWCEENETIGWQEGVPNFLAYLADHRLRDALRGGAGRPAGGGGHRHLRGDRRASGDPYSTENFPAALLQDIVTRRTRGPPPPRPAGPAVPGLRRDLRRADGPRTRTRSASSWTSSTTT